MFEKSLYDLIRGMRYHKGNEREYIQNSLRECRAEIRGSDMDLKATALLKLVYLEMFGHDMSWASFHVLEVMSSPKWAQKRVGYLSAVQSFRPDTEVLMLATNLLKKDIMSPSAPTVSLPLIMLPHVVTPSLAMSLLSDLMPRLTHKSPNVRKKTVVTLYRLALVYPETLRPAWPKIKDILMDDEDDNVTAAVVNVVCELGWRRPQDFLALAPRLFDLLVAGKNNWMAIKIIKLFATLTPLEPRLVKKLLPPLTELIRTTPAMSLLYECIHGIIQGGILESQENFRERDEVAELCVEKLRGMIAVDRDPNLKYVALLAFRNIVRSHPELVMMHQDVILDCINDPDISIRLQALELGSGMINMENIVILVDRLLQQLRESPSNGGHLPQGEAAHEIEPLADDLGDPERTLRADRATNADMAPVPPEYQDKIIRQVLAMCCKDSFANVPDFEWYIDVLVELVRLSPGSVPSHLGKSDGASPYQPQDIGSAIGTDLQNVTVRVSSVRGYAVRAAAGLLSTQQRQLHFPGSAAESQRVLAYAAWIVGEYARLLHNKEAVLDNLLSPPVNEPAPAVYCAYIQAIPKILAAMFTSELYTWDVQQQTMSTLLLARVISFLESLTTHPNLEVQERAVEFAELLKVTKEALSQHSTDSTEPPYLVTHVIPSLFSGAELGPVAASAQSKVPLPDGLDLTAPFNESLVSLLQEAEQDTLWSQDVVSSYRFYYEKPSSVMQDTPSASSILTPSTASTFTPSDRSYQSDDNASVVYQDRLGQAERRQRQKDDPFYIGSTTDSAGRTPLHDMIRTNNGEEIDIDSIPIMNLDLGEASDASQSTSKRRPQRKQPKRQQISIAAEETIEDQRSGSRPQSVSHSQDNTRTHIQSRLLQVDSSGLANLSLNEAGSAGAGSTDPYSKNQAEEAEMAKALAEVERLRMEMQRASERLHLAEGIPDDGTLVKKKKKKKKKAEEPQQDAADSSAAVPEVELKKKKKKKKKPVEIAEY